MSKAENPDDDPRTDDDEQPEWSVEENGVELRKVSYSTYEFQPVSGVTIEFSKIRDYDDEPMKLRSSSSTTDKAVLDLEELPEQIELAFTILAES